MTSIDVSGGFEDRIETGFLSEIAVDRNGIIYVRDGWYGAILVSPAAPSFTTPLSSQRAAIGGTATFAIEATGATPIRFQWMKAGVAIPEATSPTLTIENVGLSDLGNYSVRATSAVGAIVSNEATLSLPVSSALNADGIVGFSVRGSAGDGAHPMILGFAIHGPNMTDAMPLLIRGVGPSLGLAGVAGVLADPKLTVYSGRTEIATNDNWKGDAQVSARGTHVDALPLASGMSRDAALYHPGLRGGIYTMQVSGIGAGSGVALAEIYDARSTGGGNTSAPRLSHVSALTGVANSSEPLVATFTIGGAAAKTLLLRAIGPTLGVFAVTDALADPKLELFRGAVLLESNDNWAGEPVVASAAADIGAFPLNAASGDAAFVITLRPGSYTVRVSGVAGTTGIALLEISEIPAHPDRARD